MRNNYYLAAGVICLFTAMLHTVGGQLALVDPLLASSLDLQVKTEWLGAWHMITFLLWYFGYVLFRNGLKVQAHSASLLKGILILSILFSIAFIGASFWQGQHAPQYILFSPIVLLVYFGLRKQ